MANIKADSQFILGNVNFRSMFTESVKTEFYNNQPFGYETTTGWNDAIETGYKIGGIQPYTTAFAGDALSISPLNIRTGTISGVVEGIFTYSGLRSTGDLVHSWSIWNVSVSLVSLRNVALTLDRADDVTMMRNMLSGNDNVRLSRFADRIVTYEGNDFVQAGAGNDYIDAGLGSDSVHGGAGVDTLLGGASNDFIVGSSGGDVLYGGTGGDVFIFDDNHLTNGLVTSDRILDFYHLSDQLNFALIDANANVAGDQAFAFLGHRAAMTGQAHSAWLNTSGSDLLVRFDTNGDSIHDIELVLVGRANLAATLSQAAMAQTVFDF